MVKVVVGATIKVNAYKFKKLHRKAFVELRKKFKRKNPDYINNEKFNFSNHDTPEFIYAFRKEERFYHFPRGVEKKFMEHLVRWKVKHKVVRTIPELDPKNKYMISNITLRDDQKVAFDSMVEKRREYGLHTHPSVRRYYSLTLPVN